MQHPKKSILLFNKKERRAILFLLLLILLSRMIPEWHSLFHSESQTDIQSLKIIRTGQMILADTARRRKAGHPYSPGINASVHSQASLFYFDPNTATATEWKLLGLSDKAISSVRNYVSKGGRFRKPQDVFRIWHIDSAKAKELLPYVKIPEYNQGVSGFKNDRTVQQKISMVDINKADSADFERLPGLGPALSSRIVAYRKLLGGYVSISQLKEVYGLGDSVLNIFLPHIRLYPHTPEKININTAGYDSLKRHPYIGFRNARIILRYRSQHGPFSDPADLKKIMIIDDAALLRLSPYLDFDRAPE